MDIGGPIGGAGAGGGAGGMAAFGDHQGIDLMSWYTSMPVVSRMYMTGAFLTTAACAVDIVSPFSLYFNWDLVYGEGQVWRLVTSYLFFGVFSVDFLFHMYFLVRYCRLLEEGDFRGRTANFVIMLAFGMLCISLIAAYTNVHFLGSALSFMMVYVWGRRNEDVRMSFLGFFTFNAPYYPYVMLGFSVLLGNSILMDLIGILVGHTYYFLEYVYPKVAEIRGWKVKRLLEPPAVIMRLFGAGNNDDHLHFHQD